MSTVTREETTSQASTKAQHVAIGALAGAMGGIVFGMMMAMMGRMSMIAMLVGSESIAVGWLVHLAISMSAGAAFVLVLGKRLDRISRALGAGAGYGMALWVVGAQVLMPARLHMPIFQFSTMAWQSLAGHLMFGMVLGAGSALGLRRLGRSR